MRWYSKIPFLRGRSQLLGGARGLCADINVGGLKPLGKVCSVSVLNQVVSSATNFALGLYLVRALAAEAFGLYGIGFAVVLFYAGVGNALLLTQMVVNTPDRGIEEKKVYAAHMFSAVMLFVFISFGAVCLTLCAVGGFWSWLRDYSGYIVAVAAASSAYLVREFFIRQAYTERKETRALKVNIAVFVALAIQLLIQSFLRSDPVTVGRALWMFAVSQLFGSVVGLALAHLPLRLVRRGQFVCDVREAWSGGRWAVGGVSITWAQSQAYTCVTAFFLGPAGVGYANAARLLISPVLFVVPALNQVIMPRLADLRVVDRARMIRLGAMFSAGLLVVAVLYSALILCFTDPLVALALGEQYEGMSALVAVWCFVLIAMFARTGAATILQVMKQFRALTLINAFSALLAVGAAGILIHFLGIPGAVIGTGVGELLLAFLLWKRVWGERNAAC